MIPCAAERSSSLGNGGAKRWRREGEGAVQLGSNVPSTTVRRLNSGLTAATLDQESPGSSPGGQWLPRQREPFFRARPAAEANRGLLSAQSSSPKLYVPSQAQLRPPKYEITALAWSSLNFPVPPEMV